MGHGSSLGDRIRKFTLEMVVHPADSSAKTEIAIRAGDVHSQMGLKNRLPAVCAALGAIKFQELSGLRLMRREGPHVGSNTVFYFHCARHPGAKEMRHPRPTASSAPRQRKEPLSVFQIDPNSEIWVSCVSKKQSCSSSAENLYTSDWFTKARNFVKSTGCRWRILSAEHGLVAPDEIIAPYEKTLNKMGVSQRRRWAEDVLKKVRREPNLPRCIVMLAGARYREFLESELEKLGIRVIVPMEGLRIGEQLRWLGEHVGRK